MTVSQINYNQCNRLWHDPHKYSFDQFTGKLHFGRPFLPGRIIVTEDLNYSGWIKLIKLTVHSSDLSYLIDWSVLPECLEVRGHFICSDFTNLIALPDTLIVQGDLILSNCTSFTTLPRQLQITGDLDFSGCIHLTALPHWISTLGPKSNGETRHVNLAHTGLSQMVIDQLKQIDPPGMKFDF